MNIVDKDILEEFNHYMNLKTKSPLFVHGDALQVLRELPDNSIDLCITSPPYWRKRQYSNGGIGLEKNYKDYISNLCEITVEIQRTLKQTGSFWLNIGDSYLNKNLLGIPWRVVFELIDNQGWILRNDIIWNKIKGGLDNSTDKLGNVHENIFHFVKKTHGYYYNVDAIRNKPRDAKIVNGAIVSATGISGVRYKRQIELSTELLENEKQDAFIKLEEHLSSIKKGEISDFRMIIRGQQRTTHSDSQVVSGRAKELKDKGFYFLKYHPKGSKPSDVWDILPEDTQKRKKHYSPYPEDLCKIPILATCPPDGMIIDPFCGTGTTLFVAKEFNRKSIGIDIAYDYLKFSMERC